MDQGQPVPGCSSAHHCWSIPRRLLPSHDGGLGSVVTTSRDYQVRYHDGIIVGVFQAVSFPAMTGAWGAWSPPLETTK